MFLRNTATILFLMLWCGANASGQYAQTSLPEQVQGNAEDHRINNGHTAIEPKKLPDNIQRPSLLSVNKQKDGDENTKSSNTNANNWFDWFEALGPKTWSNWILVFVGGLYTVFACSQWVAIRRQAKFARRTLRAIKRQENIADKSAIAALKSAQVAELALKSDRPYLLVEKADLDGVVDPRLEGMRSIAD